MNNFFRFFVDSWTYSVDEIRSSKTLQLVAWVLLLGWFLEFLTWSRFSDFTLNAVEAGRHLCWPFFQSCGDWYFLSTFPYHNTHGLAYGILFVLLIVAGYALAEKRFSLVHGLFAAFFVWEILVLGMSMRLAVNYWYFHALYAALFLFSTNKVTLLRLGAVLLYFFSGLLKLDGGWLRGEYFTALQEGLYFIPDLLIPLATNAVVVLEIVLVWFLFSKDKRIRYTVLALLGIFHAYSTLYVGFIYPAVAFPIVLILFLAKEETVSPRFIFKKNYIGAFVIISLFVIHAIPYTIEGDSRFTGEGNRFGMYMFEANYQCDSHATFHFLGGEEQEERSVSEFANRRCDPYAHWFFFKERCAADPKIERISWTFDVSVNGSDFLRIVDEDNACALSYEPLSHNAWIRIPGKDGVETIRPASPNRYSNFGFGDR